MMIIEGIVNVIKRRDDKKNIISRLYMHQCYSKYFFVHHVHVCNDESQKVDCPQAIHEYS